jgi:hypothetical protein
MKTKIFTKQLVFFVAFALLFGQAVFADAPVYPSGIHIITPAAGSTVSGTVSLQASAEEPLGAIALQFILDGNNLGAETGKVPFSYSWDSYSVSNGAHSLAASVRDINGNATTSAAVAFTVNNAARLAFDNVSVSASFSGAVISVTTSVPSSVAVDFGTSYGFGITIQSSLAMKTAHQFILYHLSPGTNFYARVRASDANFNVIYRNDVNFTTAAAPATVASPAVGIVEPGANSSLYGSIRLTASAQVSDPATIAGVTYLADGENLSGELSSAPYEFTFDSSALLPGRHYLSAVARDSLGDLVNSQQVPVTVQGTSNQIITPSNPTSGPLPIAVSSASVRLVNSGGTFYLLSAGQRFGITDPGVLASYGFEFKDAQAASTADLALSMTSRLAPADGSLVKKRGDSTVWFVTGGQKYGFTSAAVFTGQGFAWGNVREVAAEVLDPLPVGANLTDPAARHLAGVYVKDGQTIYKMESTGRRGIANLDVYNTWNVDNDFSRVVPANDADRAVSVGDNLPARTMQ